MNPTAYFYDSEGIVVSQQELTDMDLNELLSVFESSGFVPQRQILFYPDTPDVVGDYGGHRYELYKLQNYFKDALEFARSRKFNDLSGYLVTVTSQEESQFIEQFLMDHKVPNVWLGAKDYEEGHWKWIGGPEEGVGFWFGIHDGHPVGVDGVLTATYAHWREEEPNNVDDEDCSVMIASDGQWNDVVCGKVKSSLLIEFGDNPLEISPQGSEKSDL